MSTDGKLGLADRLRDSALLIRDQIDGEEGDAVFFDLDLLADEIEEMESSFENGNGGWSTLGDGKDLESMRRDLLQTGVGMLNKAVQSSIGPPGPPDKKSAGTLTWSASGGKRQQGNKK